MIRGLLCLFWVACCVFASGINIEIPLFYKPITSQHESEWGLVTYNELENTAEFFLSDTVASSSDPLRGEVACIGTHSIPNGECVGLVRNIRNASITLYRDPSSNSIQLFIGPGNDKVQVTIKPEVGAPQPKYSSRTGKPRSKRPTDTGVPDLNARELFEEIDDQEDEPEKPSKSWVQRNWMYIVPPLAILLVLLPDDSPKS